MSSRLSVCCESENYTGVALKPAAQIKLPSTNIGDGCCRDQQHLARHRAEPARNISRFREEYDSLNLAFSVWQYPVREEMEAPVVPTGGPDFRKFTRLVDHLDIKVLDTHEAIIIPEDPIFTRREKRFAFQAGRLTRSLRSPAYKDDSRRRPCNRETVVVIKTDVTQFLKPYTKTRKADSKSTNARHVWHRRPSRLSCESWHTRVSDDAITSSISLLCTGAMMTISNSRRFFQQHADKGSILTCLLNQTRQTWEQKVGFISQVYHGLRALHDCGIFHGDLRLENILVSASPNHVSHDVPCLKLIGFGSSVFLEDYDSALWADPENTTIQGPNPTSKYAAPELYASQPTGRIRVGRVRLADLYSFGLVAYTIAQGGSDHFGHDENDIDDNRFVSGDVPGKPGWARTKFNAESHGAFEWSLPRLMFSLEHDGSRCLKNLRKSMPQILALTAENRKRAFQTLFPPSPQVNLHEKIIPEDRKLWIKSFYSAVKKQVDDN